LSPGLSFARYSCEAQRSQAQRSVAGEPRIRQEPTHAYSTWNAEAEDRSARCLEKTDIARRLTLLVAINADGLPGRASTGGQQGSRRETRSKNRSPTRPGRLLWDAWTEDGRAQDLRRLMDELRSNRRETHSPPHLTLRSRQLPAQTRRRCQQ
jgi:hypothetical protein